MKQLVEKNIKNKIHCTRIGEKDQNFLAMRKEIVPEEEFADLFFEPKNTLQKVKASLRSAARSVAQNFAYTTFRNMYITRLKTTNMVSAIPEKYKNDAEVVKACIWLYPTASFFQQRGEALTYDKDICVLACTLNPENIKYLPLDNLRFVKAVLQEVHQNVGAAVLKNLRTKTALPQPFKVDEQIDDATLIRHRVYFLPITLATRPISYKVIPCVAKETYQKNTLGNMDLVYTEDLSPEDARNYIATHGTGKEATVEEVLTAVQISKIRTYRDKQVITRQSFEINAEQLSYWLQPVEYKLSVQPSTQKIYNVEKGAASYTTARESLQKLNLPLQLFDLQTWLELEEERVQNVLNEEVGLEKFDVVGHENEFFKYLSFLPFEKERCVTVYARKAEEGELGDFTVLEPAAGKDEKCVSYVMQNAFTREDLLRAQEKAREIFPEYVKKYDYDDVSLYADSAAIER